MYTAEARAPGVHKCILALNLTSLISISRFIPTLCPTAVALGCCRSVAMIMTCSLLQEVGAIKSASPDTRICVSQYGPLVFKHGRELGLRQA
jgi:hypothetical protein